MKYTTYEKLTLRQKKIYNASDQIKRVRIGNSDLLKTHVESLETALTSEDKSKVQKAAQKLITSLCKECQATRVKVKVLNKRPFDSWGELHGMYDIARKKREAVISVWMRTAVLNRMISINTFLKIIIHELVHHLDFTHYKFEDSFHTKGFYRRAASILRQLKRGGAVPPPFF